MCSLAVFYLCCFIFIKSLFVLTVCIVNYKAPLQVRPTTIQQKYSTSNQRYVTSYPKKRIFFILWPWALNYDLWLWPSNLTYMSLVWANVPNIWSKVISLLSGLLTRRHTLDPYCSIWVTKEIGNELLLLLWKSDSRNGLHKWIIDSATVNSFNNGLERMKKTNEDGLLKGLTVRLALWPHSFWSVFGTGAAAPVSYLSVRLLRFIT